ncbi:ATP-binding protein [Aquihabitans sp. McL0605]|uniref:ATP-binding protein n=1 Tax=Aquihabitans sp. McL0605 TaxID=3415671 RepID=UPI003CF8636B
MATFVFTDLVDSTATAQRVGPEAAEELRSGHFELLRRAVRTAGGVEVKGLGDGLMVMFTSPSRSLACATAMQQAVEHSNRLAAERLSVRIGIGAGEVIEDEGDYYGDAVVEAARLCAIADGGQILATDSVRVLVGRHAGQELRPIGDLVLKGITDPVPTVEVRWEPDAADVTGAPPMPAALTRVATDALFGFFGRDQALTALVDARKHALAERCVQIVLVSGEAGIGKSTLVSHAARVAHGEGATVLYGRCDEDVGAPYQPWIEGLTPLVDGPGCLADRLPAAQREALGRLTSRGGPTAAGTTDPDADRIVLMEAVIGLLALAAEAAPLVLVLDDIHWADRSSLQLIRRTAAASLTAPVLVLSTFRDTDLRDGCSLSTLLADLRREPRVSRLELHGLGDDDITQLITSAAGHELDAEGIDLAQAVRRETAGNPFFTAELLRHLGETGAIVQNEAGRWMLDGDLADLGLPNSVRDVVGRRVERLGPEAVRTLSLAAVIGRDVDIDLLQTVSGIDGDALLDLVDAATSAALIAPTDQPERYRFVHALVQHTLYSGLSPLRRQRAHRRVAEAIEATANDDRHLAALAHHWLSGAGPADAAKAMDYATRAGDAALAALAPDDAIRWYRRALDFSADHGDEARRGWLLVGLGSAEQQAGHPEHRDTLVEAGRIAEALGDDDLLVAAVLGGNVLITMREEDPELLALSRWALEIVGPDPTARRSRILASIAMSTAATDYAERQRYAREAIDVARASGDDEAIALSSDLLQMAPLDPVAGDAVSREGVAAADRTGRLALRTLARRHRQNYALMQGDLAAARQRLDELELLAGQTGLLRDRFIVQRDRAVLLLLEGDLVGCEAMMDETLAIGTELGLPEAFGQYGGQLFELRRHQGRMAEVADFILEDAANNASFPVFGSAVALVLVDAGRMADAREQLRSMVADGPASGPQDLTRQTWIINCADAAASTGDPDLAAAYRPLLAVYADEVVAPGSVVLGAASRPLGRLAQVLGDLDAADAHLQAALDVHQRLQAPYWVALTQLDLADLCAERAGKGDAARAAELTAVARATARTYGYAGLERRAAPAAT